MLERVRTPSRGFTLIEVVVVAVVASVIFLFLARWVLTLGSVTTNGLAQSTATRATISAHENLSADFQKTNACDPSTGAVIHKLNATTLELYTSVRATLGTEGAFTDLEPGTPAIVANERYLVRYELAGDRLTRSVTLVDDNCVPNLAHAANTGQRVIATGLKAVSAANPAFVASVGPKLLTGLSCETRQRTLGNGDVIFEPIGEACFATTVSVNLTAQPLGAHGGRDSLSGTYRVNETEGTL